MVDAGEAWAVVAETNERFDGFRIAVEHRFHRAVRAIPNPSGDAAGSGGAANGVTEADALDAAVDDDTSPHAA